jgi:prophage antirepressor-like protein
MNLNKAFKAQATPEVIRAIKQDQRLIDLVDVLYKRNQFWYTEDEVAEVLGITKAKLRICRREGKINTINGRATNMYTTYCIVLFLAYHSKTIFKTKNK